LLEGSYRDGVLTLSFSARSYAFTGRNLDQIIDQITENKARALCAFIEGVHEQPRDAGEIVIEGIARE
jgi:hypothetical protein